MKNYVSFGILLKVLLCFRENLCNEGYQADKRCDMVKKLEIMGMELDNCTVQEAILQIEEFLNHTVMSTVETVSMEMIVKSQADEQLKACVEDLDLVIIGDKEILKAAGEACTQRIQETADQEFLKEFIRCMAQNDKSIYLLGDDKEQIDSFQEFLTGCCDKIKVVGHYGLSDCIGDYDTVINEINIAEPDVILSVISTPEQEYFLKGNKEKLNAKIWYGLGENYGPKKGMSDVAGFAKKLIQKGMMHSMMARYNKKDE